MNITYSKRVFVALCIQHAMRMSRIILSLRPICLYNMSPLLSTRAHIFILFTAPRPPLRPDQSSVQLILEKQNDIEMQLTTYLRLMLRCRMRGAIRTLPHTSSLACI